MTSRFFCFLASFALAFRIWFSLGLLALAFRLWLSLGLLVLAILALAFAWPS